MSKKINFSVKNDELFELENEAKKYGLRVIDIIKKRYRNGLKKEKFSKRISKIESEILNLSSSINEVKDSFFSLNNALAVSLKTISSQTSISHDYVLTTLKSVVGDEKKFQEYRQKFLERSDEVSQEIFKNFIHEKKVKK